MRRAIMIMVHYSEHRQDATAVPISILKCPQKPCIFQQAFSFDLWSSGGIFLKGCIEIIGLLGYHPLLNNLLSITVKQKAIQHDSQELSGPLLGLAECCTGIGWMLYSRLNVDPLRMAQTLINFPLARAIAVITPRVITHTTICCSIDSKFVIFKNGE